MEYRVQAYNTNGVLIEKSFTDLGDLSEYLSNIWLVETQLTRDPSLMILEEIKALAENPLIYKTVKVSTIVC